MSVNQQFTINELEEGEISDSNINKQDILNIIESSKSENLKKNNINVSNKPEKNEIDDEEDVNENNEGFFLKLLDKRDDNVLKKKTERADKLNKTSKHKTVGKLVKNKNVKKFSNKKKQICQYYINGACHKGTECTFSHEAPQIRKNELCKYFLTGNCFKKDDCLYSHDTKKFPCKFFHACGFCEKGNECKFSHLRLSDEEIIKFIEQNEEYLCEMYKNYGKTNMDDFFFQYIKDKKNQSEKEFLDSLKLPSNVMIPANLNNINKPIPKPFNPIIQHPQFKPNPRIIPPAVQMQMYNQNQMIMKLPFIQQMMRNSTIPRMMPPQQNNVNDISGHNKNISDMLNKINVFEKPQEDRERFFNLPNKQGDNTNAQSFFKKEDIFPKDPRVKKNNN